MTPSTYFGNTLTDLQSGITAADRNQGDTHRAGIAANAAKMAAYFGLLSNKAKTEAEAKAHDAENARQYFALNMADAQKKAEIAARSADAATEWGNRAKLQELQEKGLTERNAASIAGQEKVAGLNLQRDLPQVAVQKMRDVEQQKAIDFEKQQTAQMAGALANQANLSLEPVKAQYQQIKTDAAKKTANRPFWGPHSTDFETTDSKILGDSERMANDSFTAGISRILGQLGKDANSFVKFNPKSNRFEPVFAMDTAVVAPRMLPDVMTGNAIQEQVETEPAPMPSIARPRMIDPGVRPAPMNIFGGAGNSVRSYIRNPSTGLLELAR